MQIGKLYRLKVNCNFCSAALHEDDWLKDSQSLFQREGDILLFVSQDAPHGADSFVYTFLSLEGILISRRMWEGDVAAWMELAQSCR